MWKTINQTESTDGKTERVHLELFLNFEKSTWNHNKQRPVIKLYYHDYKVESGWWLDKLKTRWWKNPPHKSCRIQIQYLQSHPEVTIYSKKFGYDKFTVDYCKEKAVEIFTERLTHLINQCESI